MGISQSHIFSGGDEHAAKDEARIFSGFDHPCQPKQGSVGIRTAQRFDEGTDRVEVRIPLLVVQHGSLLNRLFSDAEVDLDDPVRVGGCAFHGQFQRIQQAAGVTARNVHQVVGRLGCDLHLAVAVAAFLIAECAPQQPAQVIGFQSFESKQPRAAHQRLVDFEVGVFSGRADQREGAVFHPRQQRILLGTVEAMHLIDEQNRAQSVALQAAMRFIHLMAQILHPGQHGIERAEMGSGVIGDDPRQGGFADSWRTMQDQVSDPIGGNGASEQPAFSKDRSLTDEFIQIAWTEAVGEGSLLTS